MDIQPALVKLKENGLSLMEQQETIEALSRGLGIEQFWKGVDKARKGEREANTSYGSHLINHAVGAVGAAVMEYVAPKDFKGQEGGARKHGIAVKYLRLVDPHVAAFLALKAILDGITQSRVLQKVAIEIGRYIEDEVRFSDYQEADKKGYKYTKDKADKATTYSHKRNTMNSRMAKAGINFVMWPTVDKLHIGMKLIDIIMQVTGYVEIHEKPRTSDRHDRTKYLVLTPQMVEWIQQKNARCEILTPNYLPCVVPPRKWEGVYGGGYHTRQLRPLVLVKTSYRPYLEELQNRTETMPKVYRAVNALQETPWKINRKVLEVMRQVWDASMDTPALVTRNDIGGVTCPSCGSQVAISNRNNRTTTQIHPCFEQDGEAHRVWKISAARAHESNARLISKRIQTQKVIWIADLMKDFEKIYMPYQLDFRGRIYAVPNYLNPQGADPAKGLLTFGTSKVLGTQEAADWLAIHGANVYGNDKVSFEERIAFIQGLTPMILAIAESPMDYVKEWASVDKPFQFLAFCFEWAGYMGEGLAFESSLPIALDGSCSGIQHFSAMLRDEEGGRAVNLLPSELPHDIYQTVCNKVVEKLKAQGDSPENHPYARGWLGLKLDRKLTKRQVMTLPYGSTQYSCREYTLEHLEMLLETTSSPWGEKNIYKASAAMSEMIWDSIKETVTGARTAMDWLQKYAKQVASEGLPITWITPTGFPVLQAYRETKARRIETKLGGGTIMLTVEEDQMGLNKKRMENGISPNFVHSMDATHLILSVDSALERGIESFAMIHDSFGTHAADTELLGETLRVSFVDMYAKNDVVADFKQSMLAMLPEKKIEKLPPDLKIGTLDLANVLNSKFFFA